MPPLRNFALPGLALLGLVAYWWWRPSAETTPHPVPVTTHGKPMLEPTREASGGTPPEPSNSSAAAPRNVSAIAGEVRSTRRDRAASDALRLALRQRVRDDGRSGSKRVAEAEAAAEPVQGVLDKDYIRARIQEDLLPIAQECYESALEDDPKLAGKLVMKFSIVGDEEVGGVVDAAELDPSSDLQHAGLQECMRESMLSLAFAPPEDGGTVEVTYPFEFAPGEK